MTKEQEKMINYAVKINDAIAEMFDEDSDIHIPLSELQDGENIKCFIHALATIVPNRIFNKLTGDSKNTLEFNHVANMLIFEYAQKDTE